MGFWDVTKRVLQGKPGFEASDQGKDNWDDDTPTVDYAEERQAKRQDPVVAPDTGLFDAGGTKHIPTLGIVHTKYYLSEPYVEIWATIHNHSDRPLEADKITILGQKTELDYPLQPGQEREFRVYHGSKLTNDGYKKAELYYKDIQTGDYFRADHLIEYKFEADSTYNVVELRLITPIYDV